MHGEWFWSDLVTAKDADVVAFVEATEAPGFTYPSYAPRLTYEFFNASAWVDLFAASGARYVVPTSKHHEGAASARALPRGDHGPVGGARPPARALTPPSPALQRRLHHVAFCDVL